MGINIRKTTDQKLLKFFFDRINPVATEHCLIRIGGNNDGGYLVPDDLDGIEACFSPGVSNVATFEEELAKKGIRSYMADYSVNGPPVHNSMFDFEKFYLGAENNEIYQTLDNWVSKKTPGHPDDLILQMDIEGGEYDVLLQSPSNLLRRFRILVIEFHSLDGLMDQYGYKIISHVFMKLLSDFEIVHIHPNNASNIFRTGEYTIPGAMEFTFLRKDRIKQRTPLREFPNKYDFRNLADKKDMVLPECWYNK